MIILFRLLSTALSAEKLEWGNADQLNHILQKHPDGFDLVLGADIYILLVLLVSFYHHLYRVIRTTFLKICKSVFLYLVSIIITFEVGNLDPFYFKLVDSGYVLSLKGKEKKLALRKTGQMGRRGQSLLNHIQKVKFIIEIV